MDLILWRHADAADGAPDAARPLTAKGLQQAADMAEFLRPRLPVSTRMLVSPALRAQQTASALSDKFITSPNLDVHTTAQVALSTSGWPTARGAVILVGHQPWLGELAALIMTGKSADWRIKKGAIWWFNHRVRGDIAETVLQLALTPDQL